MTLDLLKSLDYPLAAPSANPFGYVSPTTAQHVAEKLGDQIEYILDGGSCQIGVESTIVGFEDDELIVYRLGGLTLEALEKVAGPAIIKNNQSSNPKAPGMIKSHYAPTKPVTVLEKTAFQQKLLQTDGEAGFIMFSKTQDNPPRHHFSLTATEDLNEAATRLFTALRFFEDLPVEKIYAEKVPDHGLGRAINDRLIRASSK